MPQRHMTEAFFLDGQDGGRFCLYHPPAGSPRGAVLYVHPFAEEMNKSRRMAALQARAMAGAGFAVLQIDLFGCGDSAGDFVDARWSVWKDDLARAQRWLQQRAPGPLHLWGLRLGALLACDYAQAPQAPLASLMLWQPVQSGKQFFTQFLRLKVANAMLGEGKDGATTTGALRAQLTAGASLEVAGYELAPQLAAELDAVDLAAMSPPSIPVSWFEVVPAAERPLPPVAARQLDVWRQTGVSVHSVVVAGMAFWATQEISECPALLEATDKALTVSA